MSMKQYMLKTLQPRPICTSSSLIDYLDTRLPYPHHQNIVIVSGGEPEKLFCRLCPTLLSRPRGAPLTKLNVNAL